MSKRMTRVLSLILTLVMFVSVSTPAFAWGGGDLGKGWDREIGEDEIRDFDEPVVEEEESLDYFHTLDEDSMVEVMVEAPMGALPTLAELRAEPVEIEDVREAVESVMEGETNILLAMDISFWMNGVEIEPEEPVRVKISAPELENKTNLTLVHIPDADEPETIDLIDDEDLSFALGTNEIAFETDSFSTYVITWNGNESATVHWGEMDGETFTEFDSSKIVTLDTSASTISLDVDFEGYAFSSATYKPAEGDEVSIGTTLQKVDDKWQVETRVMNAETGELDSVWVDLNNGDEIFVAYAVPQSTPGTPTDPSKVPVPDTDKNVLANEDGTRTIVLDVTGSKVTEDNSHGANVLIVLDRTASMGFNMPNSTTTRWAAAKSAIGTLVNTLTTGDNEGNDIEFGLLDFVCPSGYNSGNSTYIGGRVQDYYYINNTLHRWNNSGVHANTGSYWTKNATAYYTNYIQPNSYTHPSSAGGTNWQAALRDTQTMLAANARDDDMTYVIFLTDGEPSLRGLTSTNLSTSGDLVNPALTEARTIVGMPNIQFYGVFVGSDSGYNTLSNLVRNAGGVKTINGTDSTALNNEFAKIAETIINDLFANDVSVDDGVPSLASVSSGVVEGGVGGYEYFRLFPLTPNGSNYTYKIGETTYTVTAAQVAAGKDADGNVIEKQGDTYFIEIPWTDGNPGASYNQANGVTWDLSTVPVQPGVTYRLKFKVWPSQEAYDYIADLNNGLVKPMPSDEELKEMGIDKNAQGVYYLLTNTHLKTTYSFKGETYEDSPSETPKSEMILPTSTITVEKYWHNEMDTREATDVTLTVTKDEEAYFDIAMGTPSQINDHEWKQTPEDEIYISVGIMSCDSDGKLEILSNGHDYTVEEPENFSYRWDLTADVYHPMIINDAETATMLVLVQDKDMTEALEELEDNTKNTVDGKVYYKFGGKVYLEGEGANVLTADNDRRSTLIVNKVVEDENAPADTLFGIKVTLDNPNDPHPGEEGYSDWYHTMWFYVSTEENNRDTIVILEDDQVEGATREEGGNPEGYWWFDNGGTVTVYLKAGQYLNFNNVGRDSTYIIEELGGEDMPTGYVFDKAETAADNKQAGETSTPGVVDESNPMKVTGTIDKPNTDYKVTYTNEYLGFFYVYHSSDLTVERFPMAVDGVAYSAEKTFNLYELAKADTLYGGYYSEYAGRDKDFDVTAQDYSAEVKDANGTAYSYQAIKDGIVWSWADGYDVDAREMVPVSNAVYYLKEVPNGYLKPYTHFTYFKESKNVATLFTITDSDDLMYTSAGFLVKTDDLPAIMVESMTITAQNNSASTLTLTADKVFKSKGVLKGWLGYADITEYKGAETTIVQYWVTKDGITTYGDTQRTLTFTGTTISDIKKVDAPYKP